MVICSIKKTRRDARRQWTEREIVNAIFYLVKTGIQWDMLPNDFPPKSTVFYHFQKWNYDGTWEKVLQLLNRRIRIKEGRKPEPTLGIIDSKSVQAANKCEEKGIDGGKKIKGRKRHIVTDILGCLLHIKVHKANEHDTIAGGRVALETLDRYPSIKAFCADAGYRKTCKEVIEQILGKICEISERITDTWAVLPKRWIVERTFGWQNLFRRLSKDYEFSTCSAENMVRVSMIQLMLDRLCR